MKVVKVPISTLIPDPVNARKHNEKNIEAIKGSLSLFGQQRPLIVDKKNIVVAGNGTLEAAKALGWKDIDVYVTDLTGTQARAFALADNKTAELAEWDDEILKQTLDALLNEGFEVEEIGFDIDDVDGFGSKEGLTDADEVPEVPQNIHGVKLGDIWELGNHRLMCGDSASKESVKKLMDGELADMVFTDPPYGVAYVGKTKDALTIESDDLKPEELREKNKLWFDGVDFCLRAGGYVLATVPAGPLHLIFAQDWLDRGWLRQIMVWNKSSMVLGHSEYHYKHEPILFGWKPGDRLKNKDRTKTTVWDFDKPSASREHPTMKPVEMWEYGIGNHSKSGDVIYEPFSGSGSTLIACEKTSRKCYGMELDPHYCSVIIERWQNFTGKKAKKAEVK